jgi:ABC-2 type transport system ATP-binding protein
VLVLDEPANGLDPEGIKWLRGFLGQLAGEGRTVLVSSHMLAEVQQTVSALLVISRGRLVYEGDIGDLVGADDVATVIDAPDRTALANALDAAGIAYTPALRLHRARRRAGPSRRHRCGGRSRPVAPAAARSGAGGGVPRTGERHAGTGADAGGSGGTGSGPAHAAAHGRCRSRRAAPEDAEPGVEDAEYIHAVEDDPSDTVAAEEGDPR